MIRWLLVLALCACDRPPPPAPRDRLPVLPAPPEAEVVATVNGRALTAAQVAEQARATGQPPAQALDGLIRGELLAQAADERGLGAEPEVQRRAREAMVRRYLREAFEKENTPEVAVTALDLRKAYQAALPRLVHPPLKEVHHLLIRTKGADDKAAALAEEMRQRALKTTSVEEFNRLQDEYRERVKATGHELINEQVITAREGWTAEPFAKATFELRKPGDISPVTHTTFGYHVVRLHRDIPAENISMEEAAPTIRKDLFPRAQAREFQRWLERQGMKHQATLYPDRLRDLQQAGPAGAPP
jgi:parvulin-like peptidyl-prolyl isomerase